MVLTSNLPLKMLFPIVQRFLKFVHYVCASTDSVESK